MMDQAAIEKRLWEVFYAGASIKEMVNTMSALLEVPVRFVPFGDFRKTVASENYPEEDTDNTQLYSVADDTKHVFRESVIGRYSKMDKGEAIRMEGSEQFPPRIINWVVANGYCFGALTLLVKKEEQAAYADAFLHMLAKIAGAVIAASSYADSQQPGNEVLLKLLKGDVGGYFQLGFYSLDEEVLKKRYFRLISIAWEDGKTHALQHERLPARLKGLWYTWLNGSLVMLLASNRKHVAEDTVELLREVAKSMGVCVCIGSQFQDLLECPGQFESMLAIPRYRKNGGAELIFCDDWKECGLLHKLDLPPGELKKYCCDTLFDMLEFDVENSTGYFLTLKTFLEQDLHIARTAEALFIHYNTVQYRMNRIRELFGLDMAHAATLFQVLLSFRILEYIGEEQLSAYVS